MGDIKYDGRTSANEIRVFFERFVKGNQTLGFCWLMLHYQADGLKLCRGGNHFHDLVSKCGKRICAIGPLETGSGRGGH